MEPSKIISIVLLMVVFVIGGITSIALGAWLWGIIELIFVLLLVLRLFGK